MPRPLGGKGREGLCSQQRAAPTALHCHCSCFGRDARARLQGSSSGKAAAGAAGDMDLQQLLGDKASLADALALAKQSKIEWVQVGRQGMQ